MPKSIIKVLIVDDSKVIQDYLANILESDSQFCVVGKAKNGLEAIELTAKLKPDIISMDIHMPIIDGFEATVQIMAKYPTPIVIVSSSVNPEDINNSFRFLEAGALAIVSLPQGMMDSNHEIQKEKLIQKLKIMSEIKVITRFNRNLKEIRTDFEINSIKTEKNNDVKLITIGSSTGGPLALQKILSDIPKSFEVPIAIVQHIADGFSHGFCEWLQNTTGYKVKIATEGEQMVPGVAYVAPNGQHMSVSRNLRVILNSGDNEYGVKPSVSYLFRETAINFGEAAIGVLLTGMGRDGAVELKQMKESGAFTIVQSEESCVVFGMPGEAMKINAETHVYSPSEIGSALQKIVKKSNIKK